MSGFEPLKQMSEVQESIFSFFKIGTALGGIYVCLYCYRLGYFPSGVSVGDSLMLVWLAACLGAIYAVFCVSLTALGVIAFRVVWAGHKLFRAIRVRLGKRVKKFDVEAPPLGVVTFIFALLGILFIVLISRRATHAAYNLPLLALGQGFLYVTVRNVTSDLSRYARYVGTELVHPDKEAALARRDWSERKLTRNVALAVLLLAPLFASGVGGELMDAGMRGAGIRKDNQQILVKTNYSVLLPETLKDEVTPGPEGYTSYSNLNVALRGIGDNIVLEWQEGDDLWMRLPLPKEAVLLRAYAARSR